MAVTEYLVLFLAVATIARYEFTASAILPGFVSGIFRVRRVIFVIGALAAGISWIGMYVCVAYFLGAKVARRIGDAGTMGIIGIVVVVALALAVRSFWAWWRRREDRRW